MMNGRVQAGNIVSSNGGYSGTPLWKLKQQGALPKINQEEEEAKAAAEAAAQEQLEAAEAADNFPFLVDAVSLGRAEGSSEKPLVRHVIVKDLRKVAARSKVALPTGGLFDNRAPVLLFALFDGQSCAEQPGPLAAESCAKQVLPKLLRNLSALPPGYENATFIKATLTKTFEDLDKEILRGQPAIHDGCGGAVALMIGNMLFTGVCGKCNIVMSESSTEKGKTLVKADSMGSNQARCDLPEERKYLTENGGVVFQAEGGSMLVSGPNGGVAAVTRSMGDRAWKGPDGGIPNSVKLLRGSPETRVTEMSWGKRHQCLVITSMPVNEVVNPQECIDISMEFFGKPRAASGDIATKANKGEAQCTTVVVYFQDKDDKASAAVPPPAKKAKPNESVRLRHIVVKHMDCAQPFDPVRNRPVARSREEAEAVLRTALRELLLEAKTMKTPAGEKAKATAALQPSPKYLALCKELSECTTAQKGGGMTGDLGWLSQDQLIRFGPGFAETAKALAVGQWSDLASSEHGIHVLQRIA